MINIRGKIFYIYLKRLKPISMAPPRILVVLLMPTVSVNQSMINAIRIKMIRVSFFIVIPPLLITIITVFKNKSSI